MCKCLDTQFACCCGPSPCRLCCRFLPKMRESVSTRLMYTLILFVATVACCIMQSSHIMLQIKQIPGFNDTCITLQMGHECNNLIGYMAVYRVCFCLVVFHFVMWLLTLCITTSNSCRAGIHNGYWIVKIFVLLAMCIGSFYLPSHFFYTKGVGQIWMYIGMAGAGIFIVLQLILLVSCAYTWNGRWKGRAKDPERSRCWYFALFLCTILLFMVAIGGAIFLFVFYTEWSGCFLNKIFLGTNVGACVVLSLISYLPCTRKINPNSGLLQSAVISLYVIYLTWTALGSEPSETHTLHGKEARQYMLQQQQANPMMFTQEPMPANVDFLPGFNKSRNLTALGDAFQIAHFQVPCRPELSKTMRLVSAYIGAILMFGMVTFSSLRTTQQSDKLGIRPSQPKETESFCCCCRKSKTPLDDRGGQRIIHDEAEGVQYSYAFLHFIFMLASLYIMVQLTEWYMPETSDLTNFGLNWPSVWVKMASSWVCIIVYAVTLFVPTCWPERDISDIPMGSLPRRRDKNEPSNDPETYV